MDQTTEIDAAHTEELIRANLPFIIKTVSDVTGRYVSVEHDDTFSVALSAFAEAVERFDGERGNFLSFAALVIRSRILTYVERENRRERPASLEAMQEEGWEPAVEENEENELREEIMRYRIELEKFGLSLEQLAEHAPKHRDTRETAVSIAERAGGDENIVAASYRKKKLPIRPVAALCQVSEKIVKTSKIFILGTMLVFVKDLTCMIGWIKGAVSEHA